MELAIACGVVVVALLMVMRQLCRHYEYVIGELMEQNAKLNDRLMSRTYGEYAAGREKMDAPDAVPEIVEHDEDEDRDLSMEIVPMMTPAQVGRPREDSDAGA